MAALRKKVFRIIEPAEKGDLFSKLFDLFMLLLICLNIVAVIFETVQPHPFYAWFELVSVLIFTTEYLLRIWSAIEDSRYAHPLWGRVRYMLTPLILIDLIAILPFYLPMFIGFDMRFIRVFRLFRVFRIFKLGRYSNAMHLLGRVFRKQKEELLIVVFLMVFLMVISATLMFFVEGEVQPNHFKNIPQTMWWAVSTLTTVGYGDVVPMTVVGKVLGSVISILGIGLFALPTGILASGFTEELRRHQAEKKGREEAEREEREGPDESIYCRHCGKKL